MGALGATGRACALAAAALLVPASAAAHGRFPAVGQIAFHPTDPDVIVARTTFGLLVTEDGGGEWRWLCTDVMGARMTEDPDISVTPDGAIVAAIFDGLARGTEGGCTWEFPDPDLDGPVVIDHVQQPSEPGTLFAVTSDGGVDNSVFRSTDQGLSWEPTGDPIEPILFETIDIAPSDPSRLYLSGSYPGTAADPMKMPFVHRSSDGGVSWERFAFGGFEEGDQNIYLMGVDPTDPDHVLMRLKSENDDRLVRSTDGGETWEVVATMPVVAGLAWSEDGGTVWVGGDQESGLWRSDDGGQSFERMRDDLEVGCLALRGDELWACGNNYTDGFAIGRSTDGGETFETMLLFQDIAGMIECRDDQDTPMQCGVAYADLIRDLGLGDGGMVDGGTGGGDPDGCGCVAAGAADGPGRALPWVAAMVLVLALARRRRRGLG